MTTTAKLAKLDLKIHGMDCAEEVATLKHALVPLTGEEPLAFDVLRGRLVVDMTGVKVSEKDVLVAIGKTGLRAEPFTRTATGPARGARLRSASTLAGAVLLVAAFVTHVMIDGLAGALGSEGMGIAHAVPWAVRGIYFAAIAAAGWMVFPKALSSVARMRPDMNLLMTIAVIGRRAMAGPSRPRRANGWRTTAP